jgi:hypothetical protein
MADDMPVTQIMRLRSNANASDRSEHRNRLALTASRSTQQSAQSYEPPPDVDAAALKAVAMATQQRPAEDRAGPTPEDRAGPTPADPTPASITPSMPAPSTVVTDAEKQYQAIWAASAATIAAETAASLHHTSSIPRRSGSTP